MRIRTLVPTAAFLLMFSGAQAMAQPVVVSCASRQHAVVRDAFVSGERVMRVSCIADGSDRVVSRRYVRRQRSWGKSALIIGGSAATGAGIGGIVDGKKGALIGAALGGGAGSLFEGAKRR